MRFLTVRRLAFAALAPALFLFCVVPGCSNESEGERCGTTTTDDSDCEQGLVCVAGTMLLDTSANRCCNPNIGIVNDSRCQRSSGIVNGAGGGAGTSSIGAGGAPDRADAGDSDAGPAGAGGD